MSAHPIPAQSTRLPTDAEPPVTRGQDRHGQWVDDLPLVVRIDGANDASDVTLELPTGSHPGMRIPESYGIRNAVTTRLVSNAPDRHAV